MAPGFFKITVGYAQKQNQARTAYCLSISTIRPSIFHWKLNDPL